MTYVHAGGIDAPLMAVRHEYSDSLPGPVSIFPQANYRGIYDSGVYGGRCTTVTVSGTQLAEPHDELDFPDRGNSEGPPDQGTGPTQMQHCMGVDWPGKSMYASMERKSTWLYSPNWTGSLLQHSRDPSGQYYRRNRFYDAGSGRFTQTDPIGLAGGLNTYGFAAGDPVTYSDPFGLAPCPDCDLDFGGGYRGRVDQFDVDGASRYEIHVYKGRQEVGVVGPNGWIRKHGRQVAEVPRDVLNKINGENVTQLRRRGLLSSRGEGNIRGGRYMSGAGRLFGVVGLGLELFNVYRVQERSEELGVSPWWYMTVQMLGGDPEDLKTRCPDCIE